MAKTPRVPHRAVGTVPQTRTHKALLEAGYTVIASRGFHDATVDEICKVASVSRATFYLYFSNKKQLFMEIMNYTSNDFFVESTPSHLSPETSYHDRILAGNLGYFRAWAKYAPFLQQMFSMALIDEEIRSVYERNREKFEKRIERHLSSLRNDGGLSDCDPPLLAEALVNMIEGTTLRFFLLNGVVNGRRVSVDEVAKTLSMAWCRIVYGAVPPEARPPD